MASYISLIATFNGILFKEKKNTKNLRIAAEVEFIIYF